MNGRVNNLRSALETCEARECPPCPEVTVTEVVEVPEPVQTCNPDLSIVVRFKINSAVVSQEEMVNVYNIDKETGTPAYNMQLSKKRADAVVNILTKKYGIDANRIKMIANGSDTQPYPKNNNWNRIVIFSGSASQK